VLANLIKSKIGYEGKIKWLMNKPIGPKRRFLKIQRAKKEIGFSPKIDINEGLDRTINWYVQNYKFID